MNSLSQTSSSSSLRLCSKNSPQAIISSESRTLPTQTFHMQLKNKIFKVSLHIPIHRLFTLGAQIFLRKSVHWIYSPQTFVYKQSSSQGLNIPHKLINLCSSNLRKQELSMHSQYLYIQFIHIRSPDFHAKVFMTNIEWIYSPQAFVYKQYSPQCVYIPY